MFFEKERFNISEICNVVLYSPNYKPVYNYPGTLPTYELMYFTKGEPVVVFNKKSYKMSSGTILYLPKGIKKAEYRIETNELFSLYNIYFDTNECMPDSPILISLNNHVIKNLYEKTYRIWVSKQDGYYFKSMQLFYNILEILHIHNITYLPKNKTTLLSASETYMKTHYFLSDFDYKRLCELSGLSYSYFKKIFTDKYGMPPVKYVTHLKIERACELLSTAKFSISEIAELCGYENVYYFSNVFKKHTGCSPKNYINFYNKYPPV